MDKTNWLIKMLYGQGATYRRVENYKGHIGHLIKNALIVNNAHYEWHIPFTGKLIY